MKKIIILIATILFGISATFAQGVNIVNVSWDASECDCDETNPPTTVCSGSGNSGTWDCHDFYSDNVPCSVGDLN